MHEANRLLALLRLPRESTTTAIRPASLRGPALGRPVVASLVDLSSYWSAPMTMDAAARWLRAHPPRRLALGGTSTWGGPGGSGIGTGIGWGDRPTTAWSHASLEVGLTAIGGVTVVRADAVVLWLDPRPVRIAAGGSRLRVTRDGGCSPSRESATGVSNPGERLDATLLPAEPPTGALVCRYDGLNGSGRFKLTATADLGPAAAARLARAVRRIRLSHSVGGVTSCPADFGAVDVLVFAYTAEPDLDIWYARAGCTTLSNGHIVARGWLNPELYVAALRPAAS